MAHVVLASSSNDKMGLAVVVIAGALVVFFLFRYFSPTQRLKRQLRAAAPWKIGMLPENTAGRVVGRAQPLGEVLKAPFTGRACVMFQATVEEHSNSRGGGRWNTVITETVGVPFAVVDETGRAIVDPDAARIALDFDARTQSGTFDDATPIEESFLVRHGKASTGWFLNRGLRYREAVIEIGETIAVYGSGVREADPDAAPDEGYRGAPATRLRLTSSPRFPLLISDDPSTTEA